MDPSPKPPYIDKFYPDLFAAASELPTQLRKLYPEVDLPRDLIELVNVRVSQINGCPTCLSIHVPAARKAGVTEQKLDVLPSWRAAEIYSEAERTALELAEALTLPASSSVNPADVASRACHVFAEEQVAALEWAIITINAFNRISIASAHPVMPAKK